MRRTSRRLLGLAVGGLLLGLPIVGSGPQASAESVSATSVSATSVSVNAQAAARYVPEQAPAQQPPPPGPDLDSDPAAGQPDSRDIAIGLGGVALIGLVLLSRKLRKKPVLFIRWKK